MSPRTLANPRWLLVAARPRPEARAGFLSSGGSEYVTMDFFRFDGNGKIVEHWDSMQLIPKEKSVSGNTMY